MNHERMYVRFRGRTLGPLTSQKVKDLVRRGQITRMHELSSDGLTWSNAEEFADLFARRGSEVAVAESVSSQATADSASHESSGSSVNPHAPVEPKVDWYAHVDGENQGPLSHAELQQLKMSGTLQEHTLVWRSGLDAWQSAKRALPDLFGVDLSDPCQTFNGSSAHSVQAAGRGRAEDGLSQFAHELDRRRGWAFFFGIVLIVLSSFQIVGQLISAFVAATGSAAGFNAAPVLMGAIVGIALGGTAMTSGILLLQYCGNVKEFALRPNIDSGLVAAKRLSAYWAFAGVASLIWTVILLSILMIVLSVGLSAIDAIS